MNSITYSVPQLERFCRDAFEKFGFTRAEAAQITDVLLAADLSGIESHGIQRLIRYHKEITGGLVKLDAKPEIVKETPLSAVIEGNDAMGQTLSIQAMELAIEKAKKAGAEVAVFAEYAISGAPAYDLLNKVQFLEMCEEALIEIAAFCLWHIGKAGANSFNLLLTKSELITYDQMGQLPNRVRMWQNVFSWL